MVNALGLKTIDEVWYNFKTPTGMTSFNGCILRDSLPQLKKGNYTVFDYCCKFKTICDQLSVIGLDKYQWLFFCILRDLFYNTTNNKSMFLFSRPSFSSRKSWIVSHFGSWFISSTHNVFNTSTSIFSWRSHGSCSSSCGHEKSSNRGAYSNGHDRGCRLTAKFDAQIGIMPFNIRTFPLLHSIRHH